MVDPKKYLVLDVETNGLNPAKDDLLSISIYKPDDGKAFDRFLPLEKQSKLDPKATAVNGIRRGGLRGKKPLDQGGGRLTDRGIWAARKNDPYLRRRPRRFGARLR